MRKLISFLTFIALSLSIWATNDTCKIKVARTEKSFNITAASKNVYVRPGGNGDPKNYVFISCKNVKILCEDSKPIFLKNGHQKGKVTCWSEEKGTGKMEVKNDFHQLAPAKRINWLEFASIDTSTDVDITIVTNDGNKKEANINFRSCKEWKYSDVHISYTISEDGKKRSVKKILKKNNNRYIFDNIELKSKGYLSVLEVTHPKESNMVFNEVLFDGNNKQYTIFDENSNILKKDDIMYSTKIIADSLLNKPLSEGSHNISYVCTVLTKDGPQEITIDVPIEVEKSDNILSRIGIIVGILFALGVLAFLGIKFNNKRKDKKSTGNGGINLEGKSANNDGNKNPDNPENGNSNGGNCIDTNIEGEGEEKYHEEDPVELIINNLKEFYSTEDLTEISKNLKKPEDLKKDGIRSVINKWNTEHPENPVDHSQVNIAPFIHTIGNGYISPKGKQQLENFLTKFDIKYGGLIEDSVIEELYLAIYNKGSVDGEKEATKNNEVLLEESIKELKTKHENDEKNWIEKKVFLEKNNKTLKENYEKIWDENIILKKQTEQKDTRIKELEQQVNAQSQDHLAKLEAQIKKLDKDIATAAITIAQKDKEITTGLKNVEAITMKKEEWEAKYKKVNNELNAVGKQHKDEIDKLNSDHKEANLKQKQKYEKLLEDKGTEIETMKTQHSEQLANQKTEYDRRFTEQNSKAQEAENKLKEEHKKVISELNTQHQEKVNELNKTIEELGKSVNVGRDETIAKANQIMAAINEDLCKADEAVKAVISQRPIFVTVIRNIRSGLQKTIEQFNYYKENVWTAPNKLQQQVIEDMQGLFIDALSRSGWMNNVARLLSYSRLPKLHDGIDFPTELKNHGLDSALLENINAKMATLLGIADMGILVPAVLANDFEMGSYDYKNGDTWIDQFFPEVSTRNYSEKVFDIIQVGYTIKGQTEKKPSVQYN